MQKLKAFEYEEQPKFKRKNKNIFIKNKLTKIILLIFLLINVFF
jgi:hypothetical protein